jgi:drug/metabolite transporter (DMT)-like permease
MTEGAFGEGGRWAGRAPIAYVLLSMALFGVSPPLAKMLGRGIQPVMLAGLLYLGAFAGMGLFYVASSASEVRSGGGRTAMRRQDWPWLAGATVAGGIVAPIALMAGLRLITGFAASLLLNLEGVATALIAALLFREHTDRRVWAALAFMTLGAALLAWDPRSGRLSLAGPALLVVTGACWGLDNNLTRHISDRNPFQIATVKGLVAGSFSLSLGLALGESLPVPRGVVLALLLGALSYGASIALFVKALQGLGASRAGAFFAMGPFVGALASLVVLREWLGWVMLPAAALMAAGTLLIVFERHSHAHAHEPVTHTHEHSHHDAHHGHPHPARTPEPHVHEHTHEAVTHEHAHWPDTHHRHGHE